ncbi:UTP--glucose-1-phosphate uridylyltransferase GalU [Candidatus Babeliales bacterium]|nr:UTP--glucose-1-phosphate uridylyltransferase GalU [Candidatus Babeliales bacterium]
MGVTKAIIPAGGLGTRFLPATKTSPKEMLPILDKPAIQYIAEEGIRSGIKNFVVVTGKNKNVIEDHFDTNPELESFLSARDKGHLLDEINKVVNAADFIYVRQKEPLGLGHAVWTARHVIGDEPMAIFLPDDIIAGNTPAMGQLIQVAMQEKCNVVAVQEVPMDQVSRYGIVAIRKQFSPNLFQVKELVEKPSIAEAPSNLAIVGRYVLSPNIFKALEEQRIGAGGEIQLTDAIQSLLFAGEKVFAYKVQGMRYDIGTPLGLLKANLDFALKHPKYSEQILEYLRKLDKDFVVMQGKAQALSKGAQVAL